MQINPPINPNVDLNLSIGLKLPLDIERITDAEKKKYFEDIEKSLNFAYKVYEINVENLFDRLYRTNKKSLYHYNKKLQIQNTSAAVMPKKSVNVDIIKYPVPKEKFYWNNQVKYYSSQKWTFTQILKRDSESNPLILSQKIHAKIHNHELPIMYVIVTSSSINQTNIWNKNNINIEFKKIGILGVNQTKEINFSIQSNLIKYIFIKYKLLLSYAEKQNFILHEEFDLVNVGIIMEIKSRNRNKNIK